VSLMIHVVWAPFGAKKLSPAPEERSLCGRSLYPREVVLHQNGSGLSEIPSVE